ncbi:hypothetical protein [Cyanobium sp. ATX 6F1]|uniref:hypothetical protein n=1 Tax=unclassified Cyanobium TaxID=2627006 RepID=UPI0020CE18F7|nr:hypothetical protein [Cyanobium sp. ATX 6F1]MCP9916223.1 hypothetical protein [Cyanobium sp. ATX 6F1]
MNEPIGPPGDLPESGTALPSSYVSPWSLLGQDLRAVLASLGLRARELWRRNGSGQLPLPAFWPGALSRVFWPLVLLVALLLPLGAATLWGHGGARTVEVIPLPVPTPLETRSVAEAGGSLPATIPADEPAPLIDTAEPPAPPSPPALALDPLLELLADDAGTSDGPALLIAARPQPERSLLVLELTPDFLSRSAGELQRQADRWLQQTKGLGYDRLELVDGRGRVLGRQARVGSGMILLSYG